MPVRPVQLDLPALTAIRGVAALSVLLIHAGARFHGDLGVDFFFILSGFVLMHAHGGIPLASARAYFAFLWARLARIYPVNLLVLLILLSWRGVYNVDMSMTGFVYSLFLAQSPWFHACWNIPAWSLSAEWHAYLVFPLLAAAIRLCPRWGLAAIVAGCAALMLGLFATGAIDPGIAESPAVLLHVFPEFIIGMALYRLRDLVRFASDGVAAAVVAGIVATQALGLPQTLTVLLFPALLLCAARDGGALSKLLGLAPFRYLGRISYSLYMVQILAYVLLNAFVPVGGGWRGGIAFVLISFLLAIPVSHLVEYPARAWLRGLHFRRAEPVLPSII